MNSTIRTAAEILDRQLEITKIEDITGASFLKRAGEPGYRIHVRCYDDDSTGSFVSQHFNLVPEWKALLEAGVSTIPWARIAEDDYGAFVLLREDPTKPSQSGTSRPNRAATCECGGHLRVIDRTYSTRCVVERVRVCTDCQRTSRTQEVL